MTTKILFRDVIIALRENAFVTNSYPLILTYEMHCSFKGQKRIAEILKEEVADLLYVVSEDHDGHQFYAPLSSLMNKIIIKGKGKLPSKEISLCPGLPKISVEVIQPETSPLFLCKDQSSKQEDQTDPSDIELKIHKMPTLTRNYDVSNEKPIEVDLNNVKKKKKMTKVKKILPELNLLYGLIGRKLDLTVPMSIWESVSLSEGTIKSLYKKNLREIVNYHKKYITKIYPAKHRFDSSNFNPIVGWATGAQIIALNFQNFDEFMLINYAKFRNNGGSRCGYVLKPYYMLHDFKEKDHPFFSEQPKKPIKRVKIQIISGQNLSCIESNSRKIENIFVEVKVSGLEDEKFNSTKRTHTFSGNSFHPVWANKEKPCIYSFDIASPDFSTFIFTAYSENLLSKRRIGWYAVEMTNMQQGYRVIPLLTTDLRTKKHSYIFCHVLIENI